jgi:hypothetical protein
MYVDSEAHGARNAAESTPFTHVYASKPCAAFATGTVIMVAFCFSKLVGAPGVVNALARIATPAAHSCTF